MSPFSVYDDFVNRISKAKLYEIEVRNENSVSKAFIVNGMQKRFKGVWLTPLLSTEDIQSLKSVDKLVALSLAIMFAAGPVFAILMLAALPLELSEGQFGQLSAVVLVIAITIYLGVYGLALRKGHLMRKKFLAKRPLIKPPKYLLAQTLWRSTKAVAASSATHFIDELVPLADSDVLSFLNDAGQLVYELKSQK